MKSKKLIAAVVAALVVVAAVVCYFVFRSNDSYCQVIPKDVVALGRLDMKTLAQDNDFDASSVLKAFGLDEENVETGIDYASPIYAFATINMTYGVVASLDDADKLVAFFESQKEKGRIGEIESQRGLSWVALDTYMMAVWDDDKVLVMSGRATDQLRNDMAKYMAQGKDESILSTTLYEEATESKEPLAMLLDGKQLSLLDEKATSSAALVGQSFGYSELHLKFSFLMKDNKATLALDVLPQSENVKKHIDAMGDAFDEIDGDLIEMGMSNPTLWMGMNIDGEDLLKQLKEIPVVNQALVLAGVKLDVDKIVKAFDGDLSVAVNLTNENMTNPDVLFCAETKNANFLADIAGWDALRFHELKGGNYLSNLSGREIFMGKCKKGVYATNKEAYCTGVDKKAVGLEDLKKDIKNSNFYLTIDLQQVIAMLGSNPLTKNMADTFKDETASLDRFTITTKGLRTEVILSLKSGSNFAKWLQALGMRANSAKEGLQEQIMQTMGGKGASGQPSSANPSSANPSSTNPTSSHPSASSRTVEVAPAESVTSPEESNLDAMDESALDEFGV